jgi:hypothetical protein
MIRFCRRAIAAVAAVLPPQEVIASANTMGVLAGAEFWAWAGAGRPARYEART